MSAKLPVRDIQGYSISTYSTPSNYGVPNGEYIYFMTQDELMEHFARRAEKAREIFRKDKSLKHINNLNNGTE